MMLKSNPKLMTNQLNKHPKHNAGNMTKFPIYTTFSDRGFHFGPICLIASSGGAFFLRPDFRTLGGLPLLDRFGIPLGHPWSDLFDLGVEFRSNIAPKFKDSEARTGTNNTFKQKQTRLPKNDTDNKINRGIFTFVV